MIFDSERILRFIVRFGFQLLVFVTPILALPWTVDALDVNKQMFFFGIVAIMVIAWLAEALFARRMTVKPSVLWVPFVAFLVCVGISAGLSHEPYTSVLGQTNQEYTSAITIALMIGMACVGAHVLDARAQYKVLVAAMIGAAVAGVCSAAAFFGMTFGTLPTNLIGTPNALLVYLLAMTLLGAGMMITATASHRKHERVVVAGATIVTTLATIAGLLAVDYAVLWGLALFGSVVLFALSATRSELFSRPTRYIAPMMLCVASLFFLVLPSALPSPFPSEVALNTRTTWSIAAESMKIGAWAFGTGPGTFSMVFTQHHGADLNTSAFWDTRFDRGSSAILTMLPTVGIFAVLALVVALILLVVFALRHVLRHSSVETLPIMTAWSVLTAALFVYPQNFTLTLMFWVFTMLVLRTILPQGKLLDFERSPRMGFAAAFAFVLCGMLFLTVTFAGISRYRAEIAFAQAVTIDAQGGNVDDVIALLDDAATANRWSDVYYRNLGSALLQKVLTVAQRADADPTVVKSLIGAAVNAGVRATELGPTNVINWEVRGDIYRNVSPLISDAAAFAIASYDKAIALAPNNPKYAVSSARAYLALADTLAPVAKGDDAAAATTAKIAQDDALQHAHDALMHAITLKSDYAEARYFLAFVQERQNKLAEAVASMEIVRASAPRDVGVGLQLALLYLRQGKQDNAQRELERIIAIAPNFANAHWYLASIFEQKNDIDEAVIELETIMKLDPKNETVQKKINALKAGKTPIAPIPEPLPESEVSP